MSCSMASRCIRLFVLHCFAATFYLHVRSTNVLEIRIHQINFCRCRLMVQNIHVGDQVLEMLLSQLFNLLLCCFNYLRAGRV